eukprot:16444531-Heterocapsa_arctica.AAC.1
MVTNIRGAMGDTFLAAKEMLHNPPAVSPSVVPQAWINIKGVPRPNMLNKIQPRPSREPKAKGRVRCPRRARISP